jgi:protein-tyrosine phosphatase
VWGFKKKNTDEHKLRWLNADIHSHLLPGIDDGAPDLETSLELIRGLADLGYKKIITTPHVLWEMYPNTSDIIAEKTQEVRQAIAAERIDVEFSAAAEYYIDDHFATEVSMKKPLLTIKDKLLLVEFSMVMMPLDLKEVLFELQMQGYDILIAHPERYIYLKTNKAFYEELKDHGCQFQLNLLSIAGYYGRSVQELAEYLLKKEYYSYAGTDLHNGKHLELLKRAASTSTFARLAESGHFLNHQL